MIRRLFFFFTSFIVPVLLSGQFINDSIRQDDVKRIITYLAADERKGRVNYTKEQLEAAEFISNEFTTYGLEPFPGMSNFFIPFYTTGLLPDTEELIWNGEKVADSQFLFFSHHLLTTARDLSDFIVLQAIPPLADSIIHYNWKNTENILLWVTLPDSISFAEAIKNLKFPEGVPSSDILLVGSRDEPRIINYSGNKKSLASVLYNVVGMIPGRSRPEEAIVFSAHYDHVDKGVHGNTGEIFNGANDDASGTTAVLALARYFAMRGDNERTILFCLFAGEELGLLGSKAFVNLVKADNIKAVINIEMIGITNASGKNAFMLTGPGYSDLIKIVSRNLKGEKFRVFGLNSDPKYMFQRSDNYSFYLEGIPAHTFMCSDDNEPCYHKPCDDVKRIDINNMTTVIKAIAKGTLSLINGTDTPVIKMRK